MSQKVICLASDTSVTPSINVQTANDGYDADKLMVAVRIVTSGATLSLVKCEVLPNSAGTSLKDLLLYILHDDYLEKQNHCHLHESRSCVL